MSSLAPQAVRVRTSSGWRDVALMGPPGPGALLNAQIITGDDSGYSANLSGTGTIQLSATGGGAPLRLTYTPPVDAWWDVSLMLGLIQKVDANYNYLYGGVILSPADADGRTSSYELVTQHASVQQYEGRTVRSLFKLVAGQAYQLDGVLTGGSGGTWSYYIGKAQLQLMALAYPRGLSASGFPIPRVTSLPASPTDGQEVYFVADATNGVLWHLRYNASSASVYKWEFLGGAPMQSEVLTQETWSAGAAYQNLGTIGPAVTVPRAGDYDLNYSTEIVSGLTEYLYYTPKLGSAAANDNDAAKIYNDPTGANKRTGRRIRRTLAANDQVLMQYKRSSGASGQATALLRNLDVTPVRVS